jgi:peroxiredoxin
MTCNLTVRQFAAAYTTFRESGVEIVRVFHSPADDLLPLLAGTDPAPFPVLADPKKLVYRQYGVRHGWYLAYRHGNKQRIKEAMASGFRGKFWHFLRDGGSGLPADFLIAADGSIEHQHHGQDFTDSLSVADALALINPSIPQPRQAD